MGVFKAAHSIADLSLAVRTAFVTEYTQELSEENKRPLDVPDDDEDPEGPRAKVTKLSLIHI